MLWDESGNPEVILRLLMYCALVAKMMQGLLPTQKGVGEETKPA